MIRIGFSFLAVAVLCVLLGRVDVFVCLFVSVTLHELAHVLTARHFGGRTDGLVFTALGETALISGVTLMPARRRVLILLAGPLANVVVALLARVAYVILTPVLPNPVRIIIQQIALYNVVLCLFNLLPVFPLDGGRLMQLFCGNRMGVLRANRFIIHISRAVGLLLLLPGLVQAVLFPYNISLICMGVYLWRKNRHTNLTLTYEFFQMLNEKTKRIVSGDPARSYGPQCKPLNKPSHKPLCKPFYDMLPVKTWTVDADCPLSQIVERLEWDSYTCFLLDGKPYNRLTETALTRYIIQHGLWGTVGEAYTQMW